MVQLINERAYPPPLADEPIRPEALGRPPDIIPPDAEQRSVVWGALLFVGAILTVTTVTAAMASATVFAWIIIPLSVAVTLLLLRRPGAHRTHLYRPPPDEIGATPERLRELRRQ